MRHSLKKLFRLITQKQKLAMVILIVFMIIVALADTLSTVLLLPLMYALVDDSSLMDSVWQAKLYMVLCSTDRRDYIIKVSILLFGLYLLRGILLVLLTWSQQRFAAKNRYILAKRLFRCLVNKPYSYYLQHSTAEIQFQVTTDVNMVNNILISILTLLSESLLTVMILSFMTVISPVLMALSAILLGTILLILNFVIKKHVIKVGKVMRKTGTEVNKWIYQTTGAYKGIVVNRKQPFFVEKFAKATNISAKAVATNETLSVMPGTMVETVSLGVIFILMATFSYIGGDTQALLPVVATFSVAIVKMMPSMKKIGGALTALQYNTPSLSALSSLVDDNFFRDEEYWNKKAQADTNLLGHDVLQSEIEVKNITFQFEDAEAPLFQKISLKIPVGKSVAFVGPTGSGKTTLADIILGLHIPSKGEVLVDGVNIFMKPQWWADRIGYIPQQIYLCDDTIRNNVAMGIDEADINDEIVWKCLKDAQLDDFIRGLPNGINTMTGEAGVRLSGGQRQRIGIARALYSNPQFLVLDEATSALDNDTEKAIMDVIDNLSGEKTLLIIAHRLSTIRNCDIIYRIENGMVYCEEKKNVV